MFTKIKGKLVAVAPVGLALLPALSRAADPADAAAAMTQVTTNATGFGPAMFGLAALSVGIMIGVKWIKRARGAA